MGTNQAIDDKDRNKSIAEDIWAATGYRWSVHDHTLLVDGLSSCFYCCQDEERKKDSEKSTRPSAVHQETEGMDHFPCQSKLTVTVTCRGQPAGRQSISLRIEHHKPHVKYFRVDLPYEAKEKNCQNIWGVPSALSTMIQEDFPHVSSQQVYHAWVSFSEGLWKCAEDQIDSATALLKEMYDEADILKVETVEGVTALGWGLKRVSQCLQGKIVEIAIDATYNTNVKDMELYSVLAEQDNSSIPLAYCLLTTASSITPGKRKKALESFMTSLRDQYHVHPKFVHTDQDIAKIKSAQGLGQLEAPIMLVAYPESGEEMFRAGKPHHRHI
ncbi:hypothetical protein M422DRAFT_256416 [Sphaerobolus stellatus SS14]|uniref:MULE transposase domain-containing protein n=1 Tax=Sphaerobolus stellatus (strain SS14) TaxID=990650 RepID=A0A0C9VQZ1_SPHS4|nr:hypothetical protein M422DRAFT_256416 [Sphaerobolus stellatus SS14]